MAGDVTRGWNGWEDGEEGEEADGSTHICDDTLTEKLSQVRREGKKKKNPSLLKSTGRVTHNEAGRDGGG